MSIGAVGYRESIAGSEQRTDGLWKHLGVADVTTLRATGDLTSNLLTGHGVETCMVAGSPFTGIIQALNRDAASGSRYCDLIIGARNINILPQEGGTLTLPASSIATANIQANAVQQRIGGYNNGNSQSINSAGSWAETTISFTATCSGAEVRFEWNVTANITPATGYSYLGLGMDGTTFWAIGMIQVSANNYNATISGTGYTTPSAGTHRFSVFVNTQSTTITFRSDVQQMLWATEQKR